MFVDNDCASSVFLMCYDVSGLIVHCQFQDYLKIFCFYKRGERDEFVSFIL